MAKFSGWVAILAIIFWSGKLPIHKKLQPPPFAKFHVKNIDFWSGALKNFILKQQIHQQKKAAILAINFWNGKLLIQEKLQLPPFNEFSHRFYE